MDKQNINTFMMSKGANFPEEQLVNIRQKLENVSDENYAMLLGTEFKSPTLTLILSILLGYLGVDRFLIGDTGMGVGKLLTCGGCGIWWIIDCFLIQKTTKQKNMQKLEMMLATFR